MRRLLGGLLGGKGDAKEVLTDVLNGLQGDGVTDEVWDRCLKTKELEDVIHDGLPRQELAALLVECPEAAFHLCARCVAAAEEVVLREEAASAADEGPDMSEEAELALANALVVLTHLLCATAPAGGGTEDVEHPLLDMLWEPVPGSAANLGQRAVDATLRTLFLDGFGVDIPDAKDGKEDGEPPAARPAVDPALLWSEGVGPEGVTADKADDDTRANRQLGLQLLAALLCGGAPCAPPQGSSDEGEAKGEAADKATVVEAAASAERAMRPLVADMRAMLYLTDPERRVPRRPELFYSLMSVALSYDPHGFGLPYAGYFSGAKEESFAHLCLQVLGLLLQDGTDAMTEATASFVAWRPQERLRAPGPTSPSAGPHIFRDLMRDMTSEREVSFLVSSVVTLVGTVTEERSTYLPNSMRLPPFLPELLVLVFHLSRCDAFVAGVCKEGEVASLVEGVLHAALEAPEHVHDDSAALLAWATLARLTAYRDFCIACNEDFTGDVPDDLPDFSGSAVDLLALAAFKTASDKCGTTRASPIHRIIVEAALSTFANLSPFAEGLAMETCFRLFAFLERCAKSANPKRMRAGGVIGLPYVLEAIENILQYQYSSNLNLAYGIMTRQAIMRDLHAASLAVDTSCTTGSGLPTPNGSGQVPTISTDPSEGSDFGGPGRGTPTEFSRWWRELQAHLDPIIGLMDAVVPHLEKEVERKDISNPEDAKELLPRSILGLLPVPPAFTLRSLRYNECTHRVCEHCLVACLAHGPLADLWQSEEQAEAEVAGKKKEAASRRAPRRPATAAPAAATSSGSGFAPPARGGAAASSAAAAAGAAASAAAEQGQDAASAHGDEERAAEEEDDFTELEDEGQEEEEEEDGGAGAHDREGIEDDEDDDEGPDEAPAPPPAKAKR